MQQSFFSRLQDFIDLRHPLVVLFYRIDWVKLHASIAPLVARKPSCQKTVVTDTLFGKSTFVRESNPKNAGRTRISLQTLIALLYLKHVYAFSFFLFR